MFGKLRSFFKKNKLLLRAQLCTLEVPIVWVSNLAETTSFVKVTRCMDGGPALPLSCQFTVKLATPDRDLRKENRVHHQFKSDIFSAVVAYFNYFTYNFF